jgi:N-acetylmuramic acid 6-phosphate etherase
MLLALTVSGKTPWVWGAMRHAWSLGAPIAVVTQQATSEAAQLADIIIAPQTGPEAVAGFESESAHGAAADPDDADHRAGDSRRTGLQQPARRSAGQYAARAERQIAIVMAATDCSRSEAKAALASCNQHCRTAILMLLSGLDAWQARELLAEHNDHLRLRCARRRRLPELNPTARISTIRAG